MTRAPGFAPLLTRDTSSISRATILRIDALHFSHRHGLRVLQGRELPGDEVTLPDQSSLALLLGLALSARLNLLVQQLQLISEDQGACGVESLTHGLVRVGLTLRCFIR